MSINAKTDYVEEAQEVLVAPEPFGAAPKLMGILAALVDQIQTIEDDLIAIVTQRTFTGDLSGISGVHLDYLGRLIGQQRWGRIDADYRTLIIARILANSSEGAVEEVIAVVALLVGTTVEYTQQGSACYRIRWTVTTASSDALASALAELVELMTPVGVEYALIETVSSPGPVFILDSGTAGLDLGKLSTRRIM